MSQNNLKFTEFLSNVKSKANSKGFMKLFDMYHRQVVVKKPFSFLVHIMCGLTLTSYVIRHDKVEHHKTQPYH
ncbi:hypothetical protein DDB_G0276837 [Dictyostelium discoideum AX4]|uniref:Uncharacterized protein DDB_G0276837 n=1 Tax=Dictyostelium discoideum TaxID=44689 RepID=Y8993_DICDI|nr:hypothetical protein DDB_G0276837 [Dictyostelium discoideum AX4]Q86L28.1 RecName: Full=Uncharacterized protein DDB_G0276837 [Dictyostelium discoideum]EAL68920.1 hypothetical protein DDB_G0276837 [Dictyostelium discoideum AX4]|eukprot:XP_642927.1 hypothetical protein DDB_G0276837 [Dictyostelium discoideum AX4]